MDLLTVIWFFLTASFRAHVNIVSLLTYLLTYFLEWNDPVFCWHDRSEFRVWSSVIFVFSCF